MKSDDKISNPPEYNESFNLFIPAAQFTLIMKQEVSLSHTDLYRSNLTLTSHSLFTKVRGKEFHTKPLTS